MQIPMTAFNDLNGNQVLFPDSPVAFVFSTGASNQNPLQKDFMQDLDFLTLADPITCGDIIIPNGQPLIEFTDVNLEPVNFYSVNEDVYVLDTGASFSIFYIDAFGLTYAKTFHADATPFVFRPDGERVLSITGFVEPDVALFDITDPRRPKIVIGAEILPDGETFTLRFAPRSAESIFVAVTASGVAAPDAIWADRPSNLRVGSNAADYIVIVAAELETAASKLAELRRSSGMTAKVVLFEDVIDEFNDGIESPHAIPSR